MTVVFLSSTQSSRLLGAIIGILAIVAPVDAQDAFAPLPYTQSWTTGWSAFRTLGDLPRLGPLPALPFDGLSAPAPLIGLAWTAGNPAALQAEATDSRAEFRTRRINTHGDYRRPLDPAQSLNQSVVGVAWQPLTGASSAAGHITFDSHALDPSSPAYQLEPYSSNPYVMTDSARPPYRRIRARLEGAASWRIGRMGIGLALGYEAWSNRTDAAPIARLDRSARQALAIGATWRLGRVRVGATVRGLAQRSHLLVNPVFQPVQVQLVQGYQEPVTTTIVDRAFERRIAEERSGADIGLEGHGPGINWLLRAGVGRLHYQHWSVREDDPPSDVWSTTAWRIGAAAQTRLVRNSVVATFVADWTLLQGDATLAQDDSAFFHADESRLNSTLELRYAPDASAWQALVMTHAVFDARDRRDRVAEFGSNLETLTLMASIQLARRLGRRLLISAGHSAIWHRGRGSLVDPTELGPGYISLVAPEMAISGTPISPTILQASASWRASDSLTLWLGVHRAHVERTISVDALPPPVIGTRTTTGVRLGVVLGS